MNIHHSSMSPRHHAGFTLVELMVAMTIGLLLMALIATLFLTNSRTYATTDDNARMQENARYVTSVFGRMVRMAGYTPGAASVPGSFAAIAGTDGGGTASDSFTVSYYGSSDASGTADGMVVDCLGNAIGATQISVNKFYIAAGGDGQDALFCDNTGSSSGITAAATELIPDVANMQVLYGEEINGNPDLVRFVTRGDVGDINNVISLRAALLFQSPTTSAAVKDTQTYALDDVTVGPFNDLYRRRRTDTTITLRNRTSPAS